MGLKDISGDIAILGTGQMGGAILHGLLQAGVAPGHIWATAHTQEHVDRIIAESGVKSSAHNAAAVVNAAVVIVAVKPYLVSQVLKEIAADLRPNALVVSVAAGIALDTLAQAAGTDAVVRAMPNTPAQVGAAMTGVALGEGVNPDQRDQALSIMESIGRVAVVSEAQLDVLGAVSGSGPAYICLVVEAMIEGAVRFGLARPLATQVVTQTLTGTAKLLEDTGEHPAILREQVTSPGGTTAAALYELEKAGVRAAFSDALDANLRRTRELG
jgi:pyrroline-5-carboxylate reductase